MEETSPTVEEAFASLGTEPRATPVFVDSAATPAACRKPTSRKSGHLGRGRAEVEPEVELEVAEPDRDSPRSRQSPSSTSRGMEARRGVVPDLGTKVPRRDVGQDDTCSFKRGDSIYARPRLRRAA